MGPGDQGWEGQGSAKCFPLFEYSILFFSVTGNILLSLKSKSSPATFFPEAESCRGVEGVGNTVTQRENGIVRFKKVSKPREKARKGERERKKKLSQSPYLSSLSKTHPSGKIPEEKDTACESSRAGGTPTEPCPFSNYIQGCPDGATTP